jgi:hypothetical protein
MFGFPINLQDSNVKKFTNDADNGFPGIQQREIFYSIKDGNWNDQTIWQTASGRVGKLPTQNDDVYIRNVVTYTSNAFGNNIYISNTLNGIGGGVALYVNNLFSSPNSNYLVESTQLRINKNVYCSGIVSVTFGSVHYSGTNSDYSNFITQFNPGSGGFYYETNIDQNFIKGITTYYNLNISGGTYKNLTSNTIVNGTITLNGNNGFPVFECLSYDLQVGGSFIQNYGPTFSKSGPGNLLFIGQYQCYGVANIFNGNPNVEFRGGCYLSNINTTFYTGTGTWSFTTNNQSLTLNYTIETFDANIVIGPGITLTMDSNTGGGGTTHGARLNSTINGSNGTSKLIVGGGAYGGTNLYFNTAISVPSMTTGIVDFTTYANTIHYSGNYSATMPSNFSSLHSLTITGTGTKSFGVNTTINSSLFVYSGGTLDFSIYNVDVIGTTTIGATTTDRTGTINKTGAGNVIFRGELIFSNSAQPKLNFSGGNPSVELRGGISYGNGNDPLNTGTGTWTFTTNNQSIYHSSGSGPTIIFNCPILISGAITLTNATNGTSPSAMLLNNSVNGNNVNSKFTNRHILYLNNASFASLMTTGIFDITTNANSLYYTFAGNYTIPYTSFSTLGVSASGTKTLSGNTTLTGDLFVSSSGILEASIYNLSVTGTTTSSSGGSLSKNASGNILFIGLLSSNINFTGNPSVELRGGMTFGNNTINTGTGTFTFSTNNQTLTNNVGNPYTPTFSCSILISGITLTTTNNSFAQTIIISGVLNGTNGSSIFRMGTGNTPIVNYQNATQPMATGILDTSTNLNTWIYGSGNQDIKGLPTTSPKQVYRNLTLNGGGTKTLQGYVSVLNTYTLTSPATLANNGFTLTNP